MNASERFSRLLAGKPVDRLPVIEWAPWWNKTLDHWHGDGLPSSLTDTGAVQEFFGLDRCLQTSIHPTTCATPSPAAFGAGILENEQDYLRLLPTLYPAPETLFSAADEARWEADRARGDALQFFTLQGAFWFPRTLWGIQAHLFSFYDEPALYHRILEDYGDWVVQVMDTVFSRFRFDFMSFAEDMSYNNGPMISHEMFGEFLAPFYRRVIPVAHAHGVPVFLDSDGDITLAVDWYASVGTDGMFPLERQAGVDVSVYLKKQPQMCFLGHYDKMVMKQGEEAMRAEFERLLPSLQRGKVIPSVDHQTPPDVSVENYRCYVRLLKEYAAKVTHEKPLPAAPVFS